MILFMKDYYEHPTAIIDTKTTNGTFLRIAKLYKKMGIKNHAFPLVLYNPRLQGVNPHDEANLTNEQKLMIAEECKQNPWYYFREILCVPVAGGMDPVRFKANRGNIALYWLFFCHITMMLIQPRQTGKSFSSDGLAIYLIFIGALNTKYALFTKDDHLRNSNIKRLKEIYGALPSYLKTMHKKDVKNTEKITVMNLKNEYVTFLAQASKKSAADVGRGETLPIIQVDEFGHLKNLKLSLPTLLSAGNAAKDNAKANNSYYGNIYTTTAARLDNETGAYAYDVYMSGALWHESFFDCENLEELEEVVKKQSDKQRKLVVLDFNHRQLGFDDKWLVEKMEESNSTGIEAEIDYLNKWSRGNSASPLSTQDLERLSASEKEVSYIKFSKEGYVLRFYIPEEDAPMLKHKTMVLGLDTSDAVGKDDITAVFRDHKDGSVIAAGNFNETNLIQFARFIVELLMEYPKMVLIPERRSSCVAIIDFILDISAIEGFDPFRRIFNWAVGKIENNPILEDELAKPVERRSASLLEKYRKEFGFATSGSGRASRDNLYGANLLAAVKYTGSKIYDRMIIGQINGLTRRNGRIDHSVNGKDDMVIAWLLSYYFLVSAKNIHYYGIEPREVLSEVITSKDNSESIEEKMHEQEQQAIKNKISFLLDALKTVEEFILVKKIKVKLKSLFSELTQDNRNVLNIEAMIKESDEMRELKR